MALLAAIGRAIAWAVLPHAEEPALALVQGDPFARVGTPTTYRVRAYNPGPVRRPVHVVVVGWVEGVPKAGFRVEWADTLQPGGAAECWIRTDWRGEAELLAAEAGDSSIWHADDVIGRWHIEARTPDAARSPVLHASGVLVR